MYVQYNNRISGCIFDVLFPYNPLIVPCLTFHTCVSCVLVVWHARLSPVTCQGIERGRSNMSDWCVAHCGPVLRLVHGKWGVPKLPYCKGNYVLSDFLSKPTIL